MTNQIELERFRDYLGRLRDMLAEEGRDPNAFKTVLYYGISVNADPDQAFREAKHFSTLIIKRTLRARVLNSGTPADRSNIASSVCVDLSTQASTISPFARSATI
jgi:alkanesulfonate monooxygenase SsuD/methylene tetrahydromethanopterin reductase-like flavin-dependent oxidoreductase (luciferase family)